jgi:aspartokinase-like uncharacterized kinase
VIHACLAVIKVGGSLLDWPDLPLRLQSFLAEQFPMAGIERPMLIAGGGRAADVVREFDRVHHLGEETAHLLALHAMDFSAQLLSALFPAVTPIDSLESIEATLTKGLIPVLAPFLPVRKIDEAGPDALPASWDVTSDSIAARIATHVKASRLILLKSASVGFHTTRQEAACVGLVDPVFPEAARALQRVEYVNLRDPTARLEVLLP